MAAVVAHRPGTPNNVIATVHRSDFGKVEILRCNGANSLPRRVEVAARLHFTLPLVGSFVWHAEHESVFADPTAMLCTHEGEPFRITHPHGGDQSVVVTPVPHVVSQLTERAERAGLRKKRRTIVASAHTQMLAHRLCFDPTLARDERAADELLLTLLESIATGETTVRETRDEALIRRTLELVHDTTEPLPTLKAIAASMNVRAAYLTHAFAQHTGLPLYRYIGKLRLARALHRVATADEDLTAIALDLGFSSHSHLSAMFKTHYGMSPSSLRSRFGRAAARQKRGGAILKRRGPELLWRPLCAARGGTQNAV